VAAAVAGAAIGFGGGPQSDTSGAAPVAKTTPVTRTTLTQTRPVNGVLDYGNPETVTGHREGVITWLPAPGTVIRRGQPVYKVDNRPVPLFHGALPLYRPIQFGATGDDVKEVEQNLAALGYTGMTVDNTFTAATATAVRRWQEHLGYPETGVVSPTDVVLTAAEMRVTAVSAHLGDAAGNAILTYTGTTRQVRIALDVNLQSLAKVGATAPVTLPNSKTVTGTVATVGSVATASNQSGSGENGGNGNCGGGGQNPTATIEVTVTIADQSALGTLDQAPVSVKLVSASVQNVLTVPVGALVALDSGGYGVEVVTGSTRRYVPVQLGMFASGRVQITGEGVTEGTLVAVAS
jgi:peptidoglycan hydrolase-like protein with peptidoglycan-binding domain